MEYIIIQLFCLSFHVCPMLSVTRDCPFLMAPSFFSNVINMIFVYQSLSPHLLYRVNLVLLFSPSVNIFFFLGRHCIAGGVAGERGGGGHMEFKQNVFLAKCWSACDSRCRGEGIFFTLCPVKIIHFCQSLYALLAREYLSRLPSPPRKKCHILFCFAYTFN